MNYIVIILILCELISVKSYITTSLFHNNKLLLNNKNNIQASQLISSQISTQSTQIIPNQLIVILPDNNTSEGYSNFLVKPSKEKVSWYDIFTHISERLTWENINNELERNLTMKIYTMDEIIAQKSIDSADICLLVGFTNPSNNIISTFDQIYSNNDYKAIIPFNCSDILSDKYIKFGNSNSNHKEVFNFIDNISNSINRILYKEKYEKIDQLNNIQSIVNELWIRKSSDDLLFMILVLLDIFSDCNIKSVKSVTSASNTGFEELKCMCSNCAKEMFDCYTDENCRKALDCLSNCKGNDQVCSYRCITSYESQQFQNFAYCILQKNNCTKYSAKAPVYPDPKPLTTFRGKPLTFEVSDDIFIGHINTKSSRITNLTDLPILSQSSLITDDNYNYESYSWMVICGQNPAYDFFANQHQLFYKDIVPRISDNTTRSIFWYDPVFKVTTFNGEEVWRRRHYRVRRAKTPGSYYFSVIDNGVASNEYWRILDCDDNLQWAVFYYSGAASAAGTAYTGALVVSKDGKWPNMTESTTNRIYEALKKGGIQSWELFEVHNEKDYTKSGPPPLDI